MTKPNTVRLLAETRRINSDVKRANKAAGAWYESTPDWQSSEFGVGSGVHKKEDMPSTDFEYMGHKVIKQKHEPWHWTIEAIDFPTHPSLKNSTFTNVPSCERAIREYWAREKAKNQTMQ